MEEGDNHASFAWGVNPQYSRIRALACMMLRAAVLSVLAVLGLAALTPGAGTAQDTAAVRRARADSIFVPVTVDGYVRGIVGPRSVLRGLALASYDQWRGYPAGYPRTWRGFEDRAGARYGQVVISHTLRSVASRVFDERNLRYWPCGCGDSTSRLLHALAGAYRVTSPRGIHYSVLNPLTELTSGVLVTGVRPGGLHVGEGLRNGATGLVGESLFDVVREYWPWRWRPPFL
jgi:hypothetical protein